jgi:ribosomal protein S18 acetylase RimI-like enzyme
VTEIEVNAAAARNRPELFELARETFGAMPQWDDARVVEALRRDLVFVAREYERLVGYLAMRSEPEMMLIEQILVAECAEPEHVGRRLIGHAEGFAIREHARSLRIVVESSNRPARTLYRDIGFVPVDEELLELVLPQPAG